MIDIKILRENPELIRQNCIRRHAPVDFDSLLATDTRVRNLLAEVEALRAERNRLSKECKDNPAARTEVKTLKVKLASLEEAYAKSESKLTQMLSYMPNLLADDVPDGDSDADNVEIRKVGVIPQFDFPVRDHQELGELLDIIDTQRGAKVAGAGFYYWKGKGAQLVQALFYWTQMELVKRGFTLFMTPCMAKERTLYGTGYLPFFADQTYSIKDQDLAMIGTSEQTLVGYHAVLPDRGGELWESGPGNLPGASVPQGGADHFLQAGGFGEVS